MAFSPVAASFAEPGASISPRGSEDPIAVAARPMVEEVGCVTMAIKTAFMEPRNAAAGARQAAWAAASSSESSSLSHSKRRLAYFTDCSPQLNYFTMPLDYETAAI